jgi:hypothetical protein
MIKVGNKPNLCQKLINPSKYTRCIKAAIAYNYPPIILGYINYQNDKVLKADQYY